MTEGRNNIDLPTSYSRELMGQLAKMRSFRNYEVFVYKSAMKGENFFGEVYKVRLEGVTDAGKREAMKIISKFAPNNQGFRELVPVRRYYLREILSYTSILPKLYEMQTQLQPEDKFYFAECYGTCSEQTEEMIAVRDLSQDGFVLYDRLVSLDVDHASLAMLTLAKLHATSFVMKRLQSETFITLSKDVCRGLEFGVNFNKFIDQNRRQILHLFEDTEHYDRLSKYLADMETKLVEFVDPKHTEPYNVLCHGDCWTSNILFQYKEGELSDIRMIDWQMIRLASPVTDITYILFTSTDEVLRASSFDFLLKLYYDTLKSNITKMGCNIDDCYPRNVYEDHLKKYLPYGLLIAIALCPVTLCDRDECPDLVAANENYSENVDSNIKLSKTPRERLSGAVRDFIKLGYI